MAIGRFLQFTETNGRGELSSGGGDGLGGGGVEVRRSEGAWEPPREASEPIRCLLWPHVIPRFNLGQCRGFKHEVYLSGFLISSVTKLRVSHPE